MKAHAEVSIRDRIKDSVRARPRTQTILRADDVIMVWKTNPPSKRGRWVGPGVCIGTHRGSVWVNMRGSLWKCSQLQCKLATTEESRGLEIQNQLLDDMKAEFQEFPGRRVYTDVEREGIPPSDVDKQPVAPRGIQEEEDRNSALVPMLSQVTSPPSSLPELDSESHHSLREALQGEHVQVPSDVSSRPDSDCSHRTVLPDVVPREMEENVQNVRELDSDSSCETIRMSKSNFLTIPLLKDSQAVKQENEHLNGQMSHHHNVLGSRIQRVPSVGPEWMIQDNGSLPQLWKMKKTCGLIWILRCCGSSKLTITFGRTMENPRVCAKRSGMSSSAKPVKTSRHKVSFCQV